MSVYRTVARQVETYVTYTTFESEVSGDTGYEQLTSNGWRLLKKEPVGIYGGMKYTWVRDGLVM